MVYLYLERYEMSNEERRLIDTAALELMNGGDDPDWFEDALRRWQLSPGRSLEPAELAALRSLRVLLRRLAGTVDSGSPLSEPELAELNAVIGSAPVVARLEIVAGEYALDMTPQAGSWIGLALRDLGGSFTAMLLRSSPPRLKLCANEECRAAFYDETKSRTRRWCDGKTCGNRVRARRHRARKIG